MSSVAAARRPGSGRAFYGVATICGGIGEAEASVVRVGDTPVDPLSEACTASRCARAPRRDAPCVLASSVLATQKLDGITGRGTSDDSSAGSPTATSTPGDFPYTRGISAEPAPWIMGQYAGFGTAAETNGRFRALLDAGVTGFSVALDLPTQMGIDSDDPGAAGEVGKVGRGHRQPRRHRDPDGRHPARADQPGAHDGELDRLHLGGDVRRARGAAGPGPKHVRDVHPERRPQGVHRQGDADLPGRALAAPVGGRARVRGPARARWVPLADLRLSHPGIRFGRCPGDRVHVRQRDRLPGCAVARGVSIDAVAPTLFTFLSSEHRAPRGGREVQSGPPHVGEAHPRPLCSPRTPEASSCVSSSSPPARR